MDKIQLIDFHDICGLCNQLFAIALAITNAISYYNDVVICKRFLLDISTQASCPIGDVINIAKLNSYISKYGITFVDANDIYISLDEARYGRSFKYIDIKDILVPLVILPIDDSRTKFVLPKLLSLNQIFGIDPVPGIRKELKIQLRLSDYCSVERVYIPNVEIVTLLLIHLLHRSINVRMLESSM